MPFNFTLIHPQDYLTRNYKCPQILCFFQGFQGKSTNGSLAISYIGKSQPSCHPLQSVFSCHSSVFSQLLAVHSGAELGCYCAL